MCCTVVRDVKCKACLREDDSLVDSYMFEVWTQRGMMMISCTSRCAES